MMVDDDALIDRIYMALLGEAPWQGFLDHLASGMPDGKAVFFAQGFGGKPEFAAIHVGMEESALSDYAVHYAAINPWVPAMESAALGRAVTGHRLCTVEELERSAFYNDFLRPNNVASSGGLIIERNAEVQFNLTFMTSHDDHEATDLWAGQLDRLSPHLRRAARFYAKDNAHQAATEFGASLLDALDVGLLMVANGPKLTFASTAAQEITAFTALYRVSPMGRLTFTDEGLNETLHRMLRRDYEGAKTVSQTLGRLVITLLRVARDGLSQLIHGPSVVVMAEFDRQAKAGRSGEDLARDYGLTKAELRVVMGLLQGKSLPEISRAAGLSHETLRSQQRGLFEKLDVHSQIQLLNRIHGDGRIG